MNTIVKPPIAVLYAKGRNCHEETLWAVEQAGGKGVLVLLQDLLDGKSQLMDNEALIIPGGFSWGDHLSAGRIEAVHLVYMLRDQIQKFVAQNKPIFGICNGFQVLIETGLLPFGELGNPQLVLRQNNSARFEHRLVQLRFEETGIFWTRGLTGKVLTMPVAHAEGRVYVPDGSDVVFQTVCQYVNVYNEPTEQYPMNPNGSPQGIAGITDETGLIFGLMPHPERAVEDWQHSQDGRSIFANLISFLTRS